MQTDLGEHCPINLLSTLDDGIPYIRRIGPRTFDDDHCEQGKRINGFDQCPKCGLWWPCVEEPDMWAEDDENHGIMFAEGWCGWSVCCDCRLLLFTQPDGTPEAYQL